MIYLSVTLIFADKDSTDPNEGDHQCAPGSCGAHETCNGQSGTCSCTDSCRFDPQSSRAPLTDAEKMIFDNCTDELNREIYQILADNKEVLCAISKRTQLKLLITRITGDNSNLVTETHNETVTVTESETAIETEQEKLGCSLTQPSNLTNEQLIERIKAMEDRFRSMQSSSADSAFHTAMSCATSSLPNRQDISSIIDETFREVRHSILKFGNDAVIGKQF